MKHVLSKINIGFIIELLNVYVKNNSINMTWHTSVSHVPLQIKNNRPVEAGKVGQCTIFQSLSIINHFSTV